jgi:2-polyprenyl-3-methyl-5-hydroxy-6-metoxy-1,4-benzoquinol methylase
MVNQSKTCQGIRDSSGRRIVTHKFDFDAREEENYEQGVSVEMCPLFDFTTEPWMLLRHLMRQLILAHQIERYEGISKHPQELTILDVGANYGEMYTLIGRMRKAAGSKIKYIGIDIDADKKIIAKQIKSSIDYRIMDVLEIDTLPEGMVDVIICGETIEHLEEEKAILLLQKMCNILVDNGLLIMSFPTPASETHRDNPFHIKLWEGSEVANILEKNNMEILDMWHLGVAKRLWTPVRDNIVEQRLPMELSRLFYSSLSVNPAGTTVILTATKI